MSSHATAHDMAHQLVGYIPDDRRVQFIIAGEFRVPISIGAIAAIRKKRKRQEASFRRQNEDWPFNCPDPYHNGEYADRIGNMEATNRTFSAALRSAKA